MLSRRTPRVALCAGCGSRIRVQQTAVRIMSPTKCQYPHPPFRCVRCFGHFSSFSPPITARRPMLTKSCRTWKRCSSTFTASSTGIGRIRYKWMHLPPPQYRQRVAHGVSRFVSPHKLPHTVVAGAYFSDRPCASVILIHSRAVCPQQLRCADSSAPCAFCVDVTFSRLRKSEPSTRLDLEALAR